jgi:Cupin-like domain
MTRLERAVDALFDPIGVAPFRCHARGVRPVHWEPSPRRVAAFEALAAWSIDDVLAAHRGDATAWFESTTGRHLTADISPAAARRLYDGGTSIYLRQLGGLEPLGEALAAALAIPAGDVLCAVFFNHAGAHTQVHFDPVDTIALQIAGTKTWRLAPNEHAPNPTTTGIPGERRPSPELAQYARTPLPTALPADAGSYRLTPGAALHVPRGWWHETTVEAESVSLHLHIVATPWLDVVLDALRGRLVRERSLRAGADDLRDPNCRDAVLVEATAILDVVRSAVAELAPHDLVPGAAVDTVVHTDTTLARRAGAGLRVEQTAWPRSWSTSTAPIARPPSRCRAHLDMCQAFAMSSGRHPMTPAEVAATTGTVDIDQAVQLARVLLAAGFLSPPPSPDETQTGLGRDDRGHGERAGMTQVNRRRASARSRCPNHIDRPLLPAEGGDCNGTTTFARHGPCRSRGRRGTVVAHPGGRCPRNGDDDRL